MQKSILITGASSGIGKALAFELIGRGYQLGLVARRAEKLEAIRSQMMADHAHAVVETGELDVTDYSAVPRVVESVADRLGGLDIVFANAGIGLGEKVGNDAFGKMRRTIETNLLGAIATVDAAVAYFVSCGAGHIVATSSVAAFRGMPRAAAYSASKAGLAAYMEAVRAETHGKNIAVTVLFPGYIDTPLNDMLPHRPFLISAVKGAKIIADLIEKKARRAMVPAFPWNILAPLIKVLPTRVIARLG